MTLRPSSAGRRVLVGIAAGVLVVAGCSGDGSDSAAAASVEVFLARDALGERAFADVAIGSVSDARLVELAGDTRVGSASGAFVALDGACDVGALFEQLSAADDRLAAWSAAAGVEPADALSYLTSLIPAVAVEDVVVTISFYDGGTATSETTAQLQAGTAVLVDDGGDPRVRCRSGQPLRSSPVEPSVEAGLWTGEDSAGVVAGSAPTTAGPDPTVAATTTTVAPGRTTSTIAGTSTTGVSPLGSTAAPSTSTTIPASTSTTIAASTSTTIAASTSTTIAPPAPASTSTTIARGTSDATATTAAPAVPTTAERGNSGGEPTPTTSPPERGVGGGSPPESTEPPGRGTG